MNVLSWLRKRLPLILGLLLFAALVYLYIDPQGWLAEYTRDPNTGWIVVHRRTLWDWMQLLVVPIMLVAGGVLIDRRLDREEKQREAAERDDAEKRRQAELDRAEKQLELERELAADRLREQTLQSYLDRMTELMLDKGLGPDAPEDVKTVARVRTLTVLRVLDGERKGQVLKFLSEANLINTKTPVISLGSADLRKLVLSDALVYDVNLEGTNMTGAKLVYSGMRGAYLRSANIQEAQLHSIDFREADLIGADFTGSSLTAVAFIGAELGVVNLNNAVLQGVRFEDAKFWATHFEGADLKSSNITSAQVRECVIDETTILPPGVKSRYDP